MRYTFSLITAGAACALLGLATPHAIGQSAPQPSETNTVIQTSARVGFPHDSSDIPADPAVIWGELPNGFRYAILPHRDPPGRVSLRLLVQAGSLHESESQRGIAHFLEHMAFNGTRNYAPGELVDYLQRMGMGFGADTNAHTGFDETVYKLDMPQSDEAMLQTGLTVMRDYADGVLLLQQEIDRERGVILSEKRARDSAAYRSFVARYEFLFAESLLPQRLPIGIDPVIEHAGRDEFLDFYQTWYRPERMVLVVVGDVDAAAVQALISKDFSSMQAAAPQRRVPSLGRLATPGLAVGVHEEPEESATQILLASLTPYTEQTVTRALALEQIRESAVNEMLQRRLQRLAEKPDAPFMGGGAYRYDYLDFFWMSAIAVTTSTPERWQEALGVAEQTLRQALQFGFDEVELDEARAELLRVATRELREKDARKSAAVSDEIVQQVSSGSVFVSPETTLELTQAALDGFDVAAAHKVLQKMWQSPDRWVFVSGNVAIEQPQQSVREAYEGSAAVAVVAPEARSRTQWPYTEFGTQSGLAEEKRVEALDVWQAKFANNVRLNFKQTDFKKGQVMVNVTLGGGMLLLPADSPGLAQWADLALLRGGLGKLSWEQMQSLFAGREVATNFSVAESGFVFTGNTSAEDLLTQLQVIAAYLADPGYREESAQVARQRFDEVELRAKNTLMGVFSNEAARFLAGGSYRFGVPEKAAFESETLQTLAQWLAQPLGEGYVEVSIVGDVDYQTAKQAVAATFGSLSRRADTPPLAAAARESVHFPQSVPEKTLIYGARDDKALALVAWPTADYSDASLVRRLSLLSHVVSDRLRLTVRQKLGEGYSPYAFNNSSDVYKGYGFLLAMNILKPSSAREIGDLIRQIGADVATGPISEDEFKRALEPILTHIKEYRRNNGYWLNRVLASSQSMPQRLQWAISMEEDYHSITLDELQSVAARYLLPEKATIIRILPRPGGAGAAPASVTPASAASAPAASVPASAPATAAAAGAEHKAASR